MLLAVETHGEEVGTVLLTNMKSGPVLTSTVPGKNGCHNGFGGWDGRKKNSLCGPVFLQ